MFCFEFLFVFFFFVRQILYTGSYVKSYKSAQIPAAKEPVSLVRDDNKRPDGTTLLPWAKGKPMAWDVIVPDTYTESHVSSTAVTPGAAAHRAAQSKTDK